MYFMKYNCTNTSCCMKNKSQIKLHGHSEVYVSTFHSRM